MAAWLLSPAAPGLGIALSFAPASAMPPDSWEEWWLRSKGGVVTVLDSAGMASAIARIWEDGDSGTEAWTWRGGDRERQSLFVQSLAARVDT